MPPLRPWLSHDKRRCAAWLGALFVVSGLSALPPAPPADMVLIPAGSHTPLLRTQKDPAQVPVAAFYLDVQPVTNADFLQFVLTHPRWRRSQVSQLFADQSYLEHWAGDTDLGPHAPPGAPVVRISWFAARAYARWQGKRLPTIAEWELAASAGYDGPEGKNDATLHRDLYQWLAPPLLPSCRTPPWPA